MLRHTIFSSLLVLAAISLLLSCSNGAATQRTKQTETTQNGFSEAQVQASKATAAKPHHVVAVQLEHPDATADGTDSDGIAGQDSIPYIFEQDKELTFCMEDDNGQAHQLIMTDSDGKEVLQLTAGGDCVTKTIKAGSYTKTLIHDGSGGADDVNMIFIQPKFEPKDLSNVGTSSLQAVKTSDGTTCTFLDNISLLNNGSYLSTDNIPIIIDFLSEDPDPEPVFLDGIYIAYAGFTSSSVGDDETLAVYHCGGSRLVFGATWDGSSDNFLLYDTTDCVVVPDDGFGNSSSLGSGYEFDFTYNNDGTITLKNPNQSVLGVVENESAGLNESAFGSSCSGNTTSGSQTIIPHTQTFILTLTGSCIECNLEAINLSNHDLSGAKLSGAHLKNAVLSFAFMPDVDLSNADLTSANLENATFRKISGSPSVAGATLFQANFSSASLIDLDLSAAKIEGADFGNAQMVGAKLTGIDHIADSTNGAVSFVDTLLAGADFSNSTFVGGNFTNAILSTTNNANGNSVNLTVNTSLTTSETDTFDFDATIRPVSTSSTTVCPDGSSGPCSTDAQWVANNPPTYEGYNDPNDW